LVAVFDPFERIDNGCPITHADYWPVSSIEIDDRISSSVEAVRVVSKVSTHYSGPFV
jgi:hypothetical protein